MTPTLYAWGDDMRLSIFLALVILVLATLVSALPQVYTARAAQDERSNIADHMAFTKGLAEESAKLEALKDQHNAMAGQFSVIPVKIARIEERLDMMVRMVWGILAGILGLLVKEVVLAIRSIRGRNGRDSRKLD